MMSRGKLAVTNDELKKIMLKDPPPPCAAPEPPGLCCRGCVKPTHETEDNVSTTDVTQSRSKWVQVMKQ